MAGRQWKGRNKINCSLPGSSWRFNYCLMQSIEMLRGKKEIPGKRALCEECGLDVFDRYEICLINVS